ncbi:MAG: 50S ribosomal protein L6 [Alphaproteobacteria bacterium]|nr:MAG: 50S ribosomal protein L6 [Alphaproteobacteria bacterium]
MSRIGKKPIPVPSGVEVKLDGQNISVKGSKGVLSAVLIDDVIAQMTDEGVKVDPRDSSKRSLSMWGMSRTLVANLVEGVSQGFTKELEINGVGYRAQMKGKDLELSLGFSHEVIYKVPEGIDVACPKPTEITVSGIDKQLVGQVAAEIRGYRPPEPYKGKGVKYKDEYIFRKEGKKK